MLRRLLTRYLLDRYLPHRFRAGHEATPDAFGRCTTCMDKMEAAWGICPECGHDMNMLALNDERGRGREDCSLRSGHATSVSPVLAVVTR